MIFSGPNPDPGLGKKRIRISDPDLSVVNISIYFMKTFNKKLLPFSQRDATRPKDNTLCMHNENFA